MSIRQISIAYVSTAVVFLALDAVWLGTMAYRLYRPAIGHLMADRFSLAPAVLFYLLYVAGAVVFAVMPALASGRWTTALGLGALLGLLAYATYDLTNQATLSVWATKLTVLDIAWGTVLTAASATGGFFAARWAEGKFG